MKKAINPVSDLRAVMEYHKKNGINCTHIMMTKKKFKQLFESAEFLILWFEFYSLDMPLKKRKLKYVNKLMKARGLPRIILCRK